MKFRNYCVVIMGNTKNVSIEIEKVSEDKPNILDAKGIVIATFYSSLTVKELTEWFRLNDRSFFVFDLEPNSSGYHITKEEIHKGLFGFLDEINDDVLDKKAKDLLSSIEDAKIIHENARKKDYIKVKLKTKSKRFTPSEIDSMSLKEKEELMNRIIDKGVDNLTEYDKQLLPLLAK